MSAMDLSSINKVHLFIVRQLHVLQPSSAVLGSW